MATVRAEAILLVVCSWSCWVCGLTAHEVRMVHSMRDDQKLGSEMYVVKMGSSSGCSAVESAWAQ